MVKKYITEEKELELIKKSKNGDMSALEDLIKAHDAFVNCLVNKNTPQHLRSDIDSVRQEGNIGLMRAVEKFDIDSGKRFLTYAKKWILGEIKRYIQENRNIHIPVYIFENIKKINNFKKKFLEDNSREPNTEEISAELGIAVDDVVQLMVESQNTYSTDFKYDNDTTLESLLAESSSASFEKSTEVSDCRDVIFSIMKMGFSEKEIEIVLNRFGLDGREPITLDEVGSIYNISKERVRQLEEKILKKFRTKQNIAKLEMYTDNNGLLKRLNVAHKNYKNKKLEHSHICLETINAWIQLPTINEIFDIQILFELQEINEARNILLEIIKKEKENGSRKIKYFLDSLYIDETKLY